MESKFFASGWSKSSVGALVMAAAFGALVWLALPWMVVVMDDDFWYLKSVVETYQRGRPWTSEWLTPWGASTSLLVVGLFSITQSFSTAVHGALALCGGMMFLGMYSFLKAAGMGTVRRYMVAFLVLGTPTVLFMLLMFTSVALYMACLWWCLYFALKRQWLGFFLVWCVAISSRQSAIVWLAIPGWQVLQTAWRAWQSRSLQPYCWRCTAVMAAGAVMVLILKLGMNETQGQKVILSTVKDALDVTRLLLPLSMGLFTVLLGFGIASFLNGRSNGHGRRKAIWGRVLLFAALAAGLIAAGWWLQPQIVTTHAAYTGGISTAGFILWGLLAAAGLAFYSSLSRVSWGMLLAAAGSIALVALYAGHFDYYYIDAFFFSFAAACTAANKDRSGAGPGPGPDAQPREMAGAGSMAVLLIIVAVFLFQATWNARGYVRMKYAQDRYASLITLAEQSVRSGKITVYESGFAGFGYNGWKLESHYREHAGKGSSAIAGFLDYTRPHHWNGKQGTGVVAEYPKPFRKYKTWLPSHNSRSLVDNSKAEVIAGQRGKLLWKYEANFILKKFHADDQPADADNYQDVLYPLNDEEWRQFMKSGRL